MNALAAAVEAMRQWARDEIASGASVADVHRRVCESLDAVETELRIEFDVPGARYYEVYTAENERIRFTSTRPGDGIPEVMRKCVDESPRYEFLARQGLHFGYDFRL